MSVIKYFLPLLTCLLMFQDAAFAVGKNVFGLYEDVVLLEISSKNVPAKLDTGATTSSLGASNIEIFQKDDQDWVRFVPQINGGSKVEFPVVRFSRIKLRALSSKQEEEEEDDQAEEDDQEEDDDLTEENTASTVVQTPTSLVRPVIELEICLGNLKYKTEVNLADRSRFKYPLLLGAKTLSQFEALVDPSRHHLSKTNCTNE